MYIPQIIGIIHVDSPKIPCTETYAYCYMINEFYLKTLEIIKPTDYDERVISKNKFISHILECRKDIEIAYINFSVRQKEIIQLPENVRDLPEYMTLFNEGQLDWELIKRLSEQELKNLLEKCVGNCPIYVSYVEEYPKTITYRIASNMSCLVMPVDAQGKVIY